MQADAVQASLDTRNAEQAPRAAEGSLGVVVGEREHRLYVLKAEKVDWIESQGNYVKFRCRGAEFISRDSIKRLAAVLADDGFIRIGRCLIINIRSIDYAQRMGRRIYTFTMLSGSVLRSDPRALTGQRRAPLSPSGTPGPVSQAPSRRRPALPNTAWPKHSGDGLARAVLSPQGCDTPAPKRYGARHPRRATLRMTA
jgi:hypothetical protein